MSWKELEKNDSSVVEDGGDHQSAWVSRGPFSSSVILHARRNYSRHGRRVSRVFPNIVYRSDNRRGLSRDRRNNRRAFQPARDDARRYARAPRWKRFRERKEGGNPDSRRYFREGGHTLCPETARFNPAPAHLLAAIISELLLCPRLITIDTISCFRSIDNKLLFLVLCLVPTHTTTDTQLRAFAH